MNKIHVIIISMLFCLLGGCKDDGPTDGGKTPCPPILIVPSSAFTDPIWHPTGKFIGFNHTPLDSISYPFGEHCQGQLHFDYDSSGFWLIDSDGTNMRRIFSSTFQNPAWSHDGQWLAFVLQIGSEAHILKMRFTGDGFDTTTLQKLTNGGRNFFPAWSPDGQWIAYNESVCNAGITCGTWSMSSTGLNHELVAEYGNYPAWNSTGQIILSLTPAFVRTGPSERDIRTIGDSLWKFELSTKAKHFFLLLTDQNHDNRSPHYSPDGRYIAFWSQPPGSGQGNLWSMDTSGHNLRQLTTEGGGSFSWSPDGKSIVYQRYRSDDWSYRNGVLWTLNVIAGEYKQLTFNGRP